MKIIYLVCTFLLMSISGSLTAEENPYYVERTWPDYFLEHRKLFSEKQGVYKAGPNPVWTFHTLGGFIGNTTVIEGDDGLIVYDTGVSIEHGRLIAKEIKKISDKPIKAIFYSHHHTDHYNGTASLVSEGDVSSGRVKIFSWKNFEAEKDNEFGDLLPRQAIGVAYYSGSLLPPEDKHYHGCCSLNVVGGNSGYIPPTDLIDKDTEMEIAGVKFNVFHTGGEAISEFGIHIPEYDMVIIGDEFFYSLANIHSIRGSKPRLPENYITALDRVRKLQPEWLLGSHIIPIQGKDRIEKYITTSRDAIQYLWDQSIRYINKGYTPLELQYKFKALPSYLDLVPFTRPTYGTPWLITPEFYTGWVSWFSGDSVDMLHSEPQHQAKKYVEMMGGREKVLSEARQTFDDGDPQLAAELVSMLIKLDREDMDARYLKAACLRKIGYQQVNSIARSWYLTGALELEGKLDTREILKSTMKMFQGELHPARDVIDSWRYLVDAESAKDRHISLVFELSDTKESIGVELRHSIIEVQSFSTDPKISDAVVILSTKTLNKINRNEITVEDGIKSGEISVKGDKLAAIEFVGYLDREITEINMHLR
ncbi:alkyl sulfatase dimerization domain-containing protein [Halioxenophilus sp. WMMB6]|uniref:alkyl sulfatase dimerization domain-containing protein n=1 Tax=Halioxenophilus sp. WMMB6 TaxID=3073815 RepID=UPI00295E2A95|nr:alkyl sulfatase dimerization domain-containing protein [Halioxenophilus sp. WMMB6]